MINGRLTPEVLREMGLTCPYCRGDVVRREPRPGGKRFVPFYGCAKYPACTGTISEYDAGAIVHGDHSEHE